MHFTDVLRTQEPFKSAGNSKSAKALSIAEVARP